MLSDTQISRLLDVANAACHGGNVVDARAMYAGVLALRPGFAPALMGKALSHIVVDDFDEAERLLKDEDAQALLGLCYTLARRQGEAEAVLAPLAAGEGTRAELAAGLLEKLRQEP
mgnify:CR=1 FL=1